MSFLRDVTHGVRLLLKQPGFSAVAILTLGFGIGGSTAIFSVIDAVLLRPLPYPHPEQLVDIKFEERMGDGTLAIISPSFEDVRDWQDHVREIAEVAIFRPGPEAIVVEGAQPGLVPVNEASDAYLRVFGVTPLIGRGLTVEDMPAAAPPVAVLGHRLWQRRFAGDPAVIGRRISIDNVPVTVVGLLPSGFYTDAILRPLKLNAVMFPRRGIGATVHARLRARRAARVDPVAALRAE